MLIFKCALRAEIAFAADGLRRETAGGRGRFEEAIGRGIDAENIGCAILDESLGVDGPGEVHVEVAALRHLGEERCELERARLRSIEGTDGALLLCGCNWLANAGGAFCRGLRGCGHSEAEEEYSREAGGGTEH